jgi:hypothetical protein
MPMPLVLDELKWDVIRYGECFFTVTDNPNNFQIRRYNPGYMRGYNYD